MKFFKLPSVWFLVCLALLDCTVAYSAGIRRDFRPATPSNAIARLRKQIENSISPAKRDLTAGIMVVSTETGEILYERDADKLLIPASVAKLFTAYAAL